MTITESIEAGDEISPAGEPEVDHHSRPGLSGCVEVEINEWCFLDYLQVVVNEATR